MGEENRRYFRDADYAISPKVCENCAYRCKSKSFMSNKCDYILIVGHSRPKSKSTHTHCEAKVREDKVKIETKRTLSGGLIRREVEIESKVKDAS